MKQLQDDLSLRLVSGGSQVIGSASFNLAGNYEDDDGDDTTEHNHNQDDDDSGFDTELSANRKSYGSLGFPA